MRSRCSEKGIRKALAWVNWRPHTGSAMKLGLVLATILSAVVLLGAAATDKVTYVDHEKVAKGGALVTASDFNIQILMRTGPGQVEVHDKETDTFYVLDRS